MSNTMMSGEVAEIYKQMLDLQSSNHNTAITLLLGIMALILGITLYWNRKGAKDYIDKQVKIGLEQGEELLIKKIYEKIDTQITIVFKQNEGDLKRIEAEVCRSIAISAAQANQPISAIRWYSSSLEKWIDLESDRMIRLMVDLILEQLDKVDFSVKNAIKDKAGILKRVKKIPNLLEKEKKDIISKIEKFSEKED